MNGAIEGLSYEETRGVCRIDARSRRATQGTSLGTRYVGTYSGTRTHAHSERTIGGLSSGAHDVRTVAAETERPRCLFKTQNGLPLHAPAT